MRVAENNQKVYFIQLGQLLKAFRTPNDRLNPMKKQLFYTTYQSVRNVPFFSAFVIFSLANTWAQENATEDGSDTINLPNASETTTEDDNLIYLMDDFVVSAEDDQGYYSANTLAGTRTNELTKNIPMTISTVNKEMLNDFNMSTLDQLGSFVPSIESEGSSWSNQQIRFRGFLTKSQLFEFMPRYAPLDYYNVERADIIRGANSLIYGQADPGGKVNIISKTANMNKEIKNLSIDFGNKGYNKYTLDFNQPISDRAAIRIMAADRSEEYNQDYKTYDFSGATIESIFMTESGKTQFRLHAEFIDATRGHTDQAFKDGTSQSGLSGMPQNIVADPRLANLMSDDFVNYVADYNTSDPATALRSKYPNGLYTPASDPANQANDRDGALIPDYFGGSTLDEKRESIRDFYSGITPENSGTAQGPDAYRKTKASYFIGDITHRFSENLELKVALGMEFSNTDNRIRSASNVLKHSLGYMTGVNIPIIEGNASYDELTAYLTDPNYTNSSVQKNIVNGNFGDISALRSQDAASFEASINSAMRTWMVAGMSTNDLSVDVNSNGIVDSNEREAQRLVVVEQINNALSTYRTGEANGTETNHAFQQAVQQAQADINQTLSNGSTQRGFVGNAVNFLYASVPTNLSIDDKGDLDPSNDEINPATDGQSNEVTELFIAPRWEERSNKDYNKSLRTTLSYEPDFEFIPGKQQILLGVDYDRRDGSMTTYAEFQEGVVPGPNGILLANESANDYFYLSDFVSGNADEALAFNDSQQGFIDDPSDINNPNSALLRDGKLMSNLGGSTIMHKTYEADTVVDTFGTWIAASGTYWDGRLRTLLGARVDTIRVETDLTEYQQSGSNLALKVNEPFKNDDTLSFIEVSPSVGALYWITEELGVFGNFAESVISPTGFNYDVFGEITPPETGRGVELGLKYSSIDGKINAQLTGFKIDKKNEQRTNITWSELQVVYPRTSSGDIMDESTAIASNAALWKPRYDQDGEISGYQFDPVGSRVANEATRSTGVELDIYYNPVKNISLFFGYAYLDTTILESALDPIEDLTVPGTANHSANATVRYTFTEGPLKGCFIGGNQKYRSAALLNTYYADLDKDGDADYFPLDVNGDGIDEQPYSFPLRLEDQFQTDLFMGWGGKIGKGRTAPRGRFQITLLNAFDTISLISTGSNNARYTESRSVRFSASFSF